MGVNLNNDQHIPTYIPVELLIKYEHFNKNLECLNKLSLIAVEQHTGGTLLGLLTILTALICNTKIPFEPPMQSFHIQ